MQLKSAKLLEDIRDAAAFILEVTKTRSKDEYTQDRLVRQAVERNFQIIGEALQRLSKLDSEIADRVGKAPRVIAFRNIIVHGYDILDHEIVWYVIKEELPGLIQKVGICLASKLLRASNKMNIGTKRPLPPGEGGGEGDVKFTAEMFPSCCPSPAGRRDSIFDIMASIFILLGALKVNC